MAKKLFPHTRFAFRSSFVPLTLIALPLLCSFTNSAKASEASLSTRSENEKLESMRDAEILLRGWILDVDAEAGQFTMVVNEFALPNGRSSTLERPKHKIVVLGNLSPEAEDAFANSEHLLRRKVTIVGADTGNGPAIEARKLLIGDFISDSVLAPEDSDSDISAPVVIFDQPHQHETPWRPAPPSRPAPLLDAPASNYFNGVKEWVAASGLRVGPKFGITTIGGRANRGNPTSDHPRGLALDFMVNRDAKRGDIVAAYFVANAQAENVKYVIWKDKIWQGGPPMDWASLPVDYGPGYTARHMDHVHVSYLDGPYNPGPWLTQAQTLASRGGSPRSRKTTARKSRKSKSTRTRTVSN